MPEIVSSTFLLLLKNEAEYISDSCSTSLTISDNRHPCLEATANHKSISIKTTFWMIYIKKHDKAFIEVAFQKERFFKIYILCRHIIVCKRKIMFEIEIINTINTILASSSKKHPILFEIIFQHGRFTECIFIVLIPKKLSYLSRCCKIMDNFFRYSTKNLA